MNVQRPLRVTVCGHTALRSGAEIALTRLLPHLPGVEVDVVLGEDGWLAEELRRGGVPVTVLALPSRTRGLGRDAVSAASLPLSALGDTGRYAAALARHLRRTHSDLVHLNTLKSAVYGSVAGRLAGVPAVWHARDRLSSDYLPAAAVPVLRAVARRTPGVIAISRAVRDTVLPGQPVTPARPVIHDPVPPFAPACGSGGTSVVLLGRLAPWKGQDLFVRAFARVAADRPRLTGAIVGAALFGEDGYAERVRALVRERGLERRLSVDGPRDDVEELLRRADVLVHASVVPEPFGQVVAEGMAAGLAVLVPDEGGPAELVEHEVTGLVYRARDERHLAQGLARLLDDPDLRRRLGHAARRHVTAELAGPQAGARVRAVYDAVLAGRR